MKTRNLRGTFLVVLSLLVTGSFGGVHAFAAAWSSIRANNRSPGELRNNQRAFQPVPNRAPAAVSRPEAQRPREGERPRGGEARDIRGGGERGIIPARREDFDREGREHRRFDFDEDRHQLYPWAHYHPGFVTGTLPYGYMPLNVGGTPYYYYGGTYYEGAPSGYVVVTPPVGAVVPELPPGAEAVAAGPNVFYYAGGAFYAQQPQGGFVIITPPLGVIVDALPYGATPVSINGVVYYQADGAYFLPVMEGGVTVYETVQP